MTRDDSSSIVIKRTSRLIHCQPNGKDSTCTIAVKEDRHEYQALRHTHRFIVHGTDFHTQRTKLGPRLPKGVTIFEALIPNEGLVLRDEAKLASQEVRLVDEIAFRVGI